jgi:peptidoglycan/xylan/chitin deacetylase (PgdA/CDA1 family)
MRRKVKVTVFFRFDDYSETSPLDVEIGLIEALRHNRLNATFAVIPAVTEGRYHEPGERGTHPLGPKKIRVLRQAIDDGAVDCALHGFNHRTCMHAPPHSEFVGLSTQEQIGRLEQGQKLLRRLTTLEPTVFVPPWNRYDERTLEAMRECGLTCISANRYGPFQNGPLRFVPITTDMPELRSALEHARMTSDDDPIVGVLLHPYDFVESGDSRAVITCDGFNKELQWLAAQPDVTVASISALAARNRTLDVERYAANSPSRLESSFPPFISTTDQTPVYRSTETGKRVKRRNLSTTLLILGSVPMLGGVVATALHSRLRLPEDGGPAAATALSALVLAALLIRARRLRAIYFRTAMLGALVTGVLISSLLRALELLELFGGSLLSD